MTDRRPSLLIVSFSDIASDARVKKQVQLFAEDYRVTVCGRGEPVRDDVEHVRLTAAQSRAGAIGQAICLRSRAWRAAFAFEAEKRQAMRLLRGRRFDVAIANDAESIAVASRFAGPEHTLADLHEYWPGVQDQSEAWVKIRRPYYQWMMREHAAKAGAATTVSQAIADRYTAEFGFACGVVRNATPKHDLDPTPVHDPIRIVHSGSTQPNRKPEVMMRAVAQSTAPVVMDMFMTGQQTAYAQSLHALADELGDRIRILPPKPYEELIPALNQYDLGIFVLPPTTTNYSLALPNKFFDYVQARLGLVISPLPDMSALVHEYDLGAVTTAFDEDSVREVLDELTPERVQTWKANADRAADELYAERELPVWKAAIDGLVSRPHG